MLSEFTDDYKQKASKRKGDSSDASIMTKAMPTGSRTMDTINTTPSILK